ncbi:MAG: porin family protein [Pseudomonadota bacterium]
MFRFVTMVSLLSLGMATGMANGAMADALTETPADSVVLTPFPVDTSPNWTGFWVGGELGVISVGVSPGSGNEEGVIAGLAAGYDYDFGTFVLGGGFDYDLSETDVGNTGSDLENVFRVRLRAGFEIGRGLLYGTGGYAQADTDALGSEDGYFLGAGYEHLITPRFSYGTEVIFHDFNDYGDTSVDVDATTVQLRGTFRF